MKSFKNDLAPIGFYFDIFPTDLFQTPVMPIPMRIDKISNGHATLFILPKITELNQLCKKLDLQINFRHFFSIGIQNLVSFARKTYKELVYKDLETEKIAQWLNESKKISGSITNLTNDFTFLISEYLKLYSFLKKKQLDNTNENHKIELIRYCDKIIDYFQDILERNAFVIVENDSPKEKKLYRVKKDKYYPNIIPLKVEDLASNKTKMGSFIPYLIYDDILDCFAYNRELLTENTQTPCDIKIWSENNIIVGLQNQEERVLKDFSFLDINFKTIE